MFEPSVNVIIRVTRTPLIVPEDARSQDLSCKPYTAWCVSWISVWVLSLFEWWNPGVATDSASSYLKSWLIVNQSNLFRDVSRMMLCAWAQMIGQHWKCLQWKLPGKWTYFRLLKPCRLSGWFWNHVSLLEPCCLSWVCETSFHCWSLFACHEYVKLLSTAETFSRVMMMTSYFPLLMSESLRENLRHSAVLRWPQDIKTVISKSSNKGSLDLKVFKQGLSEPEDMVDNQDLFLSQS